MLTFVALSFHPRYGGSYGCGYTVEQAKKELRLAGGSTAKNWMLYGVEHEADQGPTVDAMGGLHYRGKLVRSEERQGATKFRDCLEVNK